MKSQLNQSRNFVNSISSDTYLEEGSFHKIHSLRNSNKKFKNNSSFAFESIDDHSKKKYA